MTRKKTAEYLGTIRVNNGQLPAEIIRERDPDGATASHAVVRRSAYVHERLRSTGKLAPELFDAAEKFRADFERAQLSGNYGRVDIFKTKSGRQEISDRVALARKRIKEALAAQAVSRPDTLSPSQSCMWNVIGLGMTLEQWTDFVRSAGAAMNADKASGILHSSLERLALHYGMIDMGKMAALRQDKGYGRGVRAALEFITVFNATAQPTEKLGMARLMKDLHKRFGKFA
ncbi:MAG: DUF6456 domain-containing protein [Acidobacteriaceae bacterium]